MYRLLFKILIVGYCLLDSLLGIVGFTMNFSSRQTGPYDVHVVITKNMKALNHTSENGLLMVNSNLNCIGWHS